MRGGFECEAAFSAVVVHGSKQDFASSPCFCFLDPVEEQDIGGDTASVEVYEPLSVDFAGIYGQYYKLASKLQG